MAPKTERWFAQRRRTKLLELAYRQITLAIDTVTEPDKAMNAVRSKTSRKPKRALKDYL